MGEYINKLAQSSKHYYSFIENIVKETRAYFENADEGYTILCANYLNEDRFDEDEKLVLSVFNSDDISNQIFIYGAVQVVMDVKKVMTMNMMKTIMMKICKK